jgi:hypothetical protein
MGSSSVDHCRHDRRFSEKVPRRRTQGKTAQIDRLHKHRYCGVLAPNAKLRRAVIASAGPAGATLQVIGKRSINAVLT